MGRFQEATVRLSAKGSPWTLLYLVRTDVERDVERDVEGVGDMALRGCERGRIAPQTCKRLGDPLAGLESLFPLEGLGAVW